MADNSINLMPEDLRQKEQQAREKQQPVIQEPDLAMPEKAGKVKETSKDLSGSRPSFFANIGKLFAKKDKPVSNDIVPPVKVNDQPIKREPLHIITQESNRSLLATPPVDQMMPPAVNQAPIPVPEKDSKFHQPEKIIRARFVEEGGVNLVPSSVQVKSWKQITTLFIIALVSSLVIVAIFYFGLLTWNTTLEVNRAETLDKIEEIEQKLLDLGKDNKEINKKGKEISLVYQVLNKHIYWSNFFNLLEKYSLSEVYYTSFSAGNNGAITLDAVAKTYADVGRQLKILQQPEAKEFAVEAEISSASVTDEGVSFTVTLVLNPDLFYYQELD